MDAIPLQQPQQLAPVLRALRTQAGLSQAELAQRLGISHQAVSQLERHPDRATVGRVMRVLAVLRTELVLRPMAQGTEPGKDIW